jgi:hypothetical protein
MITNDSILNYTKEDFQRNLPALINSKHWIVQKDGTVKVAGMMSYIWENIKGFFGAKNWTDKNLVKYEIIQLLAKGKEENWIDDTDLKAIQTLASKAGLIPAIKLESVDILKDDLISLRTNFFEEHRTNLNPYMQEIEKFCETTYPFHSNKNKTGKPLQELDIQAESLKINNQKLRKKKELIYNTNHLLFYFWSAYNKDRLEDNYQKELDSLGLEFNPQKLKEVLTSLKDKTQKFIEKNSYIKPLTFLDEQKSEKEIEDLNTRIETAQGTLKQFERFINGFNELIKMLEDETGEISFGIMLQKAFENQKNSDSSYTRKIDEWIFYVQLDKLSQDIKNLEIEDRIDPIKIYSSRLKFDFAR